MPLGKDFSIIADSTVSSSPQIEGDATLQVKRATRTYGRRREEPQVDNNDSSVLSVEDLSGIRSVHNTAPPGLRDEIPASSPRTHLADSDVDGRDDDNETASFGKFKFKWQEDLKKIDESDEDADISTAREVDDIRNISGFGVPLLLQPTASELPAPRTPNDRKALSPTPPLVEDVFQAGPSAVRTETLSSVASRDISSPSPSPSPVLLGRSRKPKQRVIAGSDSEQEHPKDSSSTTASASSSKHKSRRSSTPPTSEEDVPAQVIPKSRSAGKRKERLAPRARVPPLQFTEDAMSELRKTSSLNKKKKTKAPTVKEQEEMIKERSRILVQTSISIPRGEVSKYSIDSFFAKISTKQPEPTTLTSDPIVQFSSPSKEIEAPAAQDDKPPVSPRPRMTIVRRPPTPVNDDSDEDSDLPEIGEVLTAGIKKDAKQKELLELKKRYLQQRSSAANDHVMDEDDDELEIVQSNPKIAVKEEQEHRRAIHKRPSEGRKRQMQLAQINPSKQANKNELAISPVRKAHGQAPLSILHQVDPKDFSQKKLNQILAAEAQRKARMEMEKKEAEYQKHGGRVTNHGDAQAQGLTAVIQNVAERGLKVAESRSADAVDADDEEDEEDQDWNPAERGSASPEPSDGEEKMGSDEEEENDENMPLDEDVDMADNTEVEDERKSNVRRPRRTLITSDSEEENDENAPIISPGESSKERYKRATSSCDIGTEEEEDKENNTKLMYDRSEDKENTAVVRHGALEQAPRAFSGDDIPTPPVSPSRQRSGAWGARNWEQEDDDENTPNHRRPLKDLISEESPTLGQILPTNLTQSFTAKLQQASPLPSTMAPTPVLKPLFSDESSMNISSGFSQFSQAEGDSIGAAPGLQPGFSDLFESTTQKEGKNKEISSDHEHIRNLKRSDTLGLTQDFTALKDLQPPFQGSDNLIRKADAIFEKEQAFILEDATRKPQQKPEVYVNDHGFLTQTKPTDRSPEVYRPSPSQHGLYNRQNHLLSAMQSGSRTPLGTLSMTSVTDSPTQTSPLRRLQKFDRTPPRRNLNDLSDFPVLAEPSRRAANAFDVLADGAQKLKRKDELKSRPELAAFLEDEAAESDDEGNFGFAKPKTTEDDENGEDLDATLEELMDDKDMDQDTIAPELVHAKYMEQVEVDDREMEKFHQGVIQGEQRMKRRRGVEVDDSEDSEVEEDNERARRAMKKLRKSDRHDIKTLENDETTRAFAESYNMTLKDDDTEFLYLDHEGSGMPNEHMRVDREGGSEDEQDENNEPETVTHDEITRRVRQMQEEGIEDTGMDPQDVSWVDREGDQDEAPRVKTINTRVRSRGRVQVALEQSDMDGMGAAFRKPANVTTNSSKQWYAQEQKSRNAGTSRSVGGSAITGHAKAKSKTGNGTVRAGSMIRRSDTASSSTSGSSNGSRPVRPAPSVLAVISDKSRHFA